MLMALFQLCSSITCKAWNICTFSELDISHVPSQTTYHEMARKYRKRQGRGKGKYHRKYGRFHRAVRRSSGAGRVYNFKRTLSVNIPVVNPVGGSISGANGSINSSIGIALSDLPGYTDFTNLYDEYRILAIKTRWTPNFTAYSSGSTNQATYPPTLCTVLDRNDSAPISSRPVMMEYQTFRERPSSRINKIYCKTYCQSEIYRTGVSSAWGAARGKQWINISSNDVPYYAYKWSLFWPVAGTGSETVGNIVMDTTVYLQCRNVK